MEEKWAVDWPAFDKLLAKAAAAAKAGDLASAAAGHLRAIVSPMAQFGQQRTASSDSSVFVSWPPDAAACRPTPERAKQCYEAAASPPIGCPLS